MSLSSVLPAPPGVAVPSGTALRALSEPAPEETAAPGDITTTVPDTMEEGAQGAVDSLGPFWGILSTVLVGVVIALAVVTAAAVLINVVLRGRPALRRQVARCRVPVAVALSLMAARIALGLTASEYDWFEGTNFLLLAGIIGSLAWLALRIVRIVEERVLAKYQSAGEDDRRDRKIQTQTVLIRRILEALIIVIAVAVILLTIPQVRAVGAGLLASAGLLSVVAGLAVQSTLTNVFAGVQLAFTDAIRVGDVVTVEDVYGTIEDITLSYVVVKIWDGRRVIFPSSHFTTTPFENWTRVGSALSGTVEMEVDWRVPMEEARDRLRALLESTELWDGKEGSLQITDALGGMVKIRAVVSARNSGDLWDLRCLVREDLVTFLRSEHPEAIYAQRLAESVSVLSPAYAETDEAQAGPYRWDTGRSTKRHEGGAAGPAPGGSARPDREQRPATGALPRLGSSNGSHAATGQQRAVTGAESTVTGSTPLTKASEDSSMFTGSITAIERNREFAGPGEQAYQERKEKAAQADGGPDEESGHPDSGRDPAADGERRARPDVSLDGD
ncbi:MAG: mechanosensitive ion channel family protein [Citricoccus sp.]|jgi:small-conductance mechanosensitive channel|nr:mechanosensitive ion channel family protein [Citricoccus sp. WCRC_4]